MTLIQPRHYPAVILIVTVLLCTAIYLPGLSGPWIFDDYTNIIENSYVHIASLDVSSLYHAAFSMESGPLRRPISVVSFTLNYYFAGGLQNSAPFKTTNLVIHLLNTILVFWLTALVLLRARMASNSPKRRAALPHDSTYLIAACTAFIWSIHPLQLTSVLYVVQRMTELAAMFTILGLICYLYGREQMLAGRKMKGLWLSSTGIIAGGALGVLSKENAALLPLFAILCELFLFQNDPPWRHWQKLSTPQKGAIWAVASVMVATALLLVVLYALPRYESREFTMHERLLTEARVLFFYISLLFVPDNSRLGHQHDDIAVSSSLLVPWTTLPSVLGITLLIISGFWLRKRNPLLGLGILWFFAGHLMESTIIPLEIAYEHRNYLPLFGFALGIASVFTYPVTIMQRRRLIWVSYVAIVMAFAGTTYLRATQWSDHNAFYRHEIAHHPLSARTQVGYSLLLEAQGDYRESQAAIRKATILDPHEAGYAVELLLLDARQKRQSSAADYAEALDCLKNEKITGTTILTLNRVDECLQTWCSVLLPHMEQWIETILNKPDAPDRGYFQYRLGRIKTIQKKYVEALNLFQKSYEADRQFLLPLFEQINVLQGLGQITSAEYVLIELKAANARTHYPRDHEIAKVETEINRLKNQSNHQ